MATPISVVIPVGPRPEHSRWLNEAAASVCSQMNSHDEMVIIENGTDLENQRFVQLIGGAIYLRKEFGNLPGLSVFQSLSTWASD